MLDEGDLPDSTDRGAGQAVCNECGHRWGPFVRSLLRKELAGSYTLRCPWCGPKGSLWFDTATVRNIDRDAVVSELDGGHLEHGEPACDVMVVRWSNVPNTDQPSLTVLDRSR